MNQKYQTSAPYVSTDYYDENFYPNELRITQEIIQKTEQPIHRDELEFIYIESGHGQLLVNGVQFCVGAGDLLLMIPYHVYAFHLQNKQKLKIYRITFSIGLLLLTSTNRRIYLEALEGSEQQAPMMSLDPRQKNKLLLFVKKFFGRSKRIRRRIV